MGRTIRPEVLLRIPGSVWPTSPGLPIGTGRCDKLSLNREIVSAALPGQVRGKTGFSVGSADVAIAQPVDRQFTPWSPSPDRLIDAGAEATLVAWDERAGTETPLGRWRVAKPAGALTSGQISVELDESQMRGRSLPNRLITYPASGAPSVDPIWIVDRLARQMGFASTPGRGVGTVANLPLCGDGGVGWSMTTGIPGVSHPDYTDLANITTPGSSWPGLVITVNVAGTTTLRLWDTESDPANPRRLDVELSAAGTATVRWGANGRASTSFTPGLNSWWPTRVQVRITASTSGGNTAYTIAGRSDYGLAWSTGTTTTAVAGAGMAETSIGVKIQALTGSLSALDVAWGTEPGPAVWAPPTARMNLLGGKVDAPWVPADADCWTAIQHVCDAWMGIAWITNDNQLRVLNRHQAAGAGRTKTRIDVDRLAEDIKWEIAADDYADRLEVSWWPVTWPDEYSDECEWTVAENLHVPASSSITVSVDLGGFVQSLKSWGHTSTAWIGQSEWDASTAPDGEGNQVMSGVDVTTTHPTPSRALVTVRNRHGNDIWMTTLIQRGAGAAVQSDEARVVRGVAAGDAKFPLTVDLGKTVQTREDAEALASWLWDRVNRPRYRALGVRLPLDWSRDLADVLTLDHPASGLAGDVLVTGIHVDLDDAGMTLDLAALPPTLASFDAVWVGKTMTAFDAVWAGKTGTTFDRTPLRTEA